MANLVIMPKQGLLMTEGTIISWLIAEGETIEAGQPLFEMETDKLTIEIESPASGTLLKILKGEGEVVPITETIAIIGEPGENYASFLDQGSQAPVAEVKEAPAEAVQPSLTTVARKPGERVRMSPRARGLAQKHQLAVEEIAGSGPEGLIIERDVKAALEAKATKPKATPVARKMAEEHGLDLAQIGGDQRINKEAVSKVLSSQVKAEHLETLVPMTGMRKVIAERMKLSLETMAQANHRMKIDVSELVRMREKLKTSGVKISYNDIFMKMTAQTLMEFPMINASLTEGGILTKHYVNLGMAVSVPNGLVVPVIKDAHLLTLQGLGQASEALVEKAKKGGLTLDDYSGGTFTISNLGMFDVDDFTPIINPPESAILGIGKIEKQPVVLEDQVVIRPMVTLSLSYDHRIIDGALAAQFLQSLKAKLTNPYLLL